jgi:hypothetical protein
MIVGILALALLLFLFGPKENQDHQQKDQQN